MYDGNHQLYNVIRTSGDDISRCLRLPFISETPDIRDGLMHYGNTHTDKVEMTSSKMDVINFQGVV